MPTNFLLHQPSVSLVNAMMNDKQAMEMCLRSVVTFWLLLFVKHSSVLVVNIEALFWVFQLIKLMLGAFLLIFSILLIDQFSRSERDTF